MGNKVNLTPYGASDPRCRVRDGQQGGCGDGSCCWERVGGGGVQVGTVGWGPECISKGRKMGIAAPGGCLGCFLTAARRKEQQHSAVSALHGSALLPGGSLGFWNLDEGRQSG